MSGGWAPLIPVSSLALGSVGRFVFGNKGAATILSALSATEGVPQITTVNVTAAANSTLYSVRVQTTVSQFGGWGFAIDRTVDFTTDGSATQTELRDGLKLALEADEVIGAVANISVGSNTVLLTGSQGGQYYTFTVSFPTNPATALTQTATQAAADGPSWTMGRFVEDAGSATTNNPRIQDITAISVGSSISYAIGHGAAATYSGRFSAQSTATGEVVNVVWGPVNAGADLAAALIAIDAELTTEVITTSGITGATVDTSSPNVVVNLPAGWNSLTEVSTSTTAAGGATIAATVTEAATPPRYYLIRDPLDRAPIRGIANNLIPPVDGKVSPVPIVYRGADTVWMAEVAAGTVTVDGGQVYVETATGSTKGRATATPSATAAPVVGATWARSETVAGTAAPVRLAS